MIDQELIINALATYRLTKLVNEDVLTSGLRERFIRRQFRKAGRYHEVEWDVPERDVGSLPPTEEPAPKLAYLVTCPWCVSPYVATGVVLAATFAPKQWKKAARVAAFSAVAGILSTKL